MDLITKKQIPHINWDLTKILPIDKLADDLKFACLILNTPLLPPFELLILLWNKACLRVTVDGGTNKWFNSVEKFSTFTPSAKFNLKNCYPDIISGDFDSIKPTVMEMCKKNGVNVIPTYDQNQTDFYKALLVVTEELPQIKMVIVVCEFYGRFDHSMSNINSLYKAYTDPKLSNMKIFMFGADSLTWLFQPGIHTIQIPEYLWSDKSTCSLLPIGKSCNVTTTGLKWNLNNDKLEFGGMVSSSNTYDIKSDKCIVTVNTDNYLLWSMTTLPIGENKRRSCH